MLCIGALIAETSTRTEEKEAQMVQANGITGAMPKTETIHVDG